jgi:hypothetical protein
VITWTFDDGNGNSIDVTQNVVIDDVTPPVAPVLADLTGECSVTAVAPTATDGCAGTITATTADPLTYTAEGTYVITWNFDDGNGNSIDVAQNVVIDDVTPPVAICPDDVVTCDGIVGSIALTDVTDNCTIPSVSYVLTGATTASGTGDASVESFNPGETMVTYTIDDGQGNTSQCAFRVDYQEVGEIVVSVSEQILTVETEGSYQWINCADNSNLEGETGSTLKPGQNGDYAVIVTRGSCSAASECYPVTISGVDANISGRGFRLYPVPAHEFLTLEMERENTMVTIKIVNSTGQVVAIDRMEKLTHTNIDMSRYESGLYMISIKSDQMNTTVSIVKE